MHAAVNTGRADILSLLIEHGADMDVRSGLVTRGTPLHDAAWEGKLDIGQYLLDRGANINAGKRIVIIQLH